TLPSGSPMREPVTTMTSPSGTVSSGGFSSGTGPSFGCIAGGTAGGTSAGGASGGGASGGGASGGGASGGGAWGGGGSGGGGRDADADLVHPVTGDRECAGDDDAVAAADPRRRERVIDRAGVDDRDVDPHGRRRGPGRGGTRHDDLPAIAGRVAPHVRPDHAAALAHDVDHDLADSLDAGDVFARRVGAAGAAA